jgi:glucosamine kinase
MILIADSGSTKTEWRSIDVEGKIHQYKTAGINPFFQTPDQIEHLMVQELLPQLKEDISTIYFYGAGCSSKGNIEILNEAFNKIFTDKEVHINHDLLGAARSLCGSEKGIACILGTGSNSCLYDGNFIIDNIPSLGFALGDEGSGAWLGKRLLQDYYGRNMPKNIQNELENVFDLERGAVLDHIYKKPMPSKYLAGYSEYIHQQINEPYYFKLVYDSFVLFISNTVMKYDNYVDLPVHFTGSIAFYYSNILRKAATDLGIYVKNISQNPIAGLTLFHQSSIK